MGAARFIAGDWGTSHLRLFLCDAQGVALDRGQRPGRGRGHGRFASVLASQTAAWEVQHGPLPTVLCGMVGSNLGWIQVPYVACPARPEHIAAACTSIEDGPRSDRSRPVLPESIRRTGPPAWRGNPTPGRPQPPRAAPTGLPSRHPHQVGRGEGRPVPTSLPPRPANCLPYYAITASWSGHRRR